MLAALKAFYEINYLSLLSHFFKQFQNEKLSKTGREDQSSTNIMVALSARHSYYIII